MKGFYIPLFFFLYSNLLKAQPGWQDFTVRYFYSILDEKGNKISFKGNKDYAIIIDNVLYKAPNIPQYELKLAKENSYNFERQICINDLSLAIPFKSINENEKQLEIKIIHGKDTMYICQSTGTGSIRSIDFQGKPTELKPDFTFQFIAGHYYFPSWTKNLLDNLPQARGCVKLENIDQCHFIIPKIMYDSVCCISSNFDSKQKYNEVAENFVVNNFIQGCFTMERTVHPTTFNLPVIPFNKPRWSHWGHSYFSTKDKDEYVGIVEFSYDTLNYSGGRGILVRFNYKENRMIFWSATENLLYSSTYRLRKDHFNNVFYQQTIIRDSTCKELIYECDFVTKFYRSIDEGKTWEVSEELTQLNNKHEIRELEFLDQNHALLFKRDKIKPKNEKYEIQQGTYYLLKDFRIIDSLKTPDDIHYNDNYNRYGFKIENDTIFLGSWSYNNFQTEQPYFQPLLIKVNNNWKFQVVEKIYFRNKPNPEETDTITYQNFIIVNSNELVLKNKGSLVLQDDLSEIHKNGLILENGNQIYLIGLSIGTLLSLDGGINWYIYPLPLEKNSGYEFLEINEQGVISHLKNSWGESGYGFNKVVNRFLILNE